MGYFFVSLILELLALFESQSKPASSISVKDVPSIPTISLLICPHFLFNRELFNPHKIVRPRIAVVRRDGRGKATQHFQSSDGDKLRGTRV